MGKFKLNKKHLFYFPVMLLLLFSLNLNTFASTSTSIHFADTELLCSYGEDSIDCTSSVQVSSSTVTLNGITYNCSNFLFPSVSIGKVKVITCGSDLNLYTNTNYTFDFNCRSGYASSSGSSTCSFMGYLYYYVNGDFHSMDNFFAVEEKTGTWTNVSGSFKTPNLFGNVSCALLLVSNSLDTKFAASTCRFDFTDIVFSIDDPLITGTPINTPSTEELENTLQEYEDVMSQLPTVDEQELADLMEFDFDSFTDGMSFVREMFERTMNTFGFNAVLVFALTVGLATYIIGRKVG